jgi:hypothetical protein
MAHLGRLLQRRHYRILPLVAVHSLDVIYKGPSFSSVYTKSEELNKIQNYEMLSSW